MVYLLLTPSKILVHSRHNPKLHISQKFQYLDIIATKNPCIWTAVSPKIKCKDAGFMDAWCMDAWCMNKCYMDAGYVRKYGYAV